MIISGESLRLSECAASKEERFLMSRNAENIRPERRRVWHFGRKSNFSLALIVGLAVLVLAPLPAKAQPIASSFRLEEPQSALGNKLFITIGGKEKKIYDAAYQAWLINEGRDVVFSGPDGAGGFENEGQSLRIYNVKTGAARKILSEYFAISALQAVKTSTAASALLVKMQDGGLGGSYFAVVDPSRGEVFFRQWAEASKINDDLITMDFFREDDFSGLIEERSGPEDPNRVIVP